jgi:hypothetical protein
LKSATLLVGFLGTGGKEKLSGTDGTTGTGGGMTGDAEKP